MRCCTRFRALRQRSAIWIRSAAPASFRSRMRRRALASRLAIWILIAAACEASTGEERV